MLHVRFFSATLAVPHSLIEMLVRYRFRLFFLALLALVLYHKDVNIAVDTRPVQPPVEGAPTTTELSVFPPDFWRALSSACRAELAHPTTPSAPAMPAIRQRQLDYLATYAPLAIAEMHRSGIPASITLAQALLESNVGQSTLATRNRNHFGIKCFSRTCKKGHCSNFSDDSHKDFFRIYPDVATSFRAHSAFLRRGKRYRSLFDLPVADYKAWAHGLKKAGYATDKRYAEKLIRLIEELGLDRYDG